MHDDVIDDAERLGERIAAHARTRALQEASAAVEGDREARSLQEQYAHAVEDVHRNEAAGRPIEPEQKRRVLALGESIRRSEPLQRLLKAHADFAEMMDGVQRAISSAVDQALGGHGGDDHEHGPGCDHDHDHPGHDHGDAGSEGPRIVLP